ncbi:hypothetical protein AN639_01505 [Candidatus Epulonipiscium fishelsonii]|uniref:Uncharacterized protein n=1 Tax=Candidatus Epulonipiscium fishelsonii TaxID=77094 RepID=A0ACC8XBS6_9FIRM|nr:hypothetical protein AN639_01505 [Epulopiscium sp. SCG-B05WGA-EpuloA1]ONI39994.1 hypothetical protein AN396_06500 [Epulopiscium sp. SCG-B11WGA-EpuloA1]
MDLESKEGVKKVKKNDLILILTVGIVAVLAFIAFNAFSTEGDVINVIIDGQQYGTFPLGKDQVIDINGTNTLEILDNTARMIHANCPDQLCIYQLPISKNRENIICLPNRMILEVVSEDNPEYDAIVQ